MDTEQVFGIILVVAGCISAAGSIEAIVLRAAVPRRGAGDPVMRESRLKLALSLAIVASGAFPFFFARFFPNNGD